jgi:hypothetical protein
VALVEANVKTSEVAFSATSLSTVGDDGCDAFPENYFANYIGIYALLVAKQTNSFSIISNSFLPLNSLDTPRRLSICH